MKKVVIICGFVMALALGLYLIAGNSSGKWSGVDESVVEKFAVQANHPPRKPLIDIGEGDLPLFCFLLAGAAGGFIAGYYFRELFPPRSLTQADGETCSRSPEKEPFPPHPKGKTNADSV